MRQRDLQGQRGRHRQPSVLAKEPGPRWNLSPTICFAQAYLPITVGVTFMPNHRTPGCPLGRAHFSIPEDTTSSASIQVTPDPVFWGHYGIVGWAA